MGKIKEFFSRLFSCFGSKTLDEKDQKKNSADDILDRSKIKDKNNSNMNVKPQPNSRTTSNVQNTNYMKTKDGKSFVDKSPINTNQSKQFPQNYLKSLKLTQDKKNDQKSIENPPIRSIDSRPSKNPNIKINNSQKKPRKSEKINQENISPENRRNQYQNVNRNNLSRNQDPNINRNNANPMKSSQLNIKSPRNESESKSSKSEISKINNKIIRKRTNCSNQNSSIDSPTTPRSCGNNYDQTNHFTNNNQSNNIKKEISKTNKKINFSSQNNSDYDEKMSTENSFNDNDSETNTNSISIDLSNNNNHSSNETFDQLDIDSAHYNGDIISPLIGDNSHENIENKDLFINHFNSHSSPLPQNDDPDLSVQLDRRMSIDQSDHFENQKSDKQESLSCNNLNNENSSPLSNGEDETSIKQIGENQDESDDMSKRFSSSIDHFENQKNNKQESLCCNNLNNENSSPILIREDETSIKQIGENQDESDELLKRFSFVSASSMDNSIIQGLPNPKGFCFLNSVMQVLRGCKKFERAARKYHENSGIAESKEEDERKILFVIHFCNMLHKLKHNENADEQLKEIQIYFESSSTGDDVNKCFMNLLSTINDVVKIPNSIPGKNRENEADSKFQEFKNINNGFVFDCFYGQFVFKMICKKCKYEFNKKFQLFKCLPLPVPETNEKVQLENCIKAFFQKSKVEVDDPMTCNCPNGTKKILSKSQVTHTPLYLFIYLDRGSLFVDGDKKNTFITCSGEFSMKTVDKDVQYRLISVIDHIGTNENGHYFCKCNYEKDKWWLLNDSQATLMGNCDIEEIITRNTIGFMFRKVE